MEEDGGGGNYDYEPVHGMNLWILFLLSSDCCSHANTLTMVFLRQRDSLTDTSHIGLNIRHCV